jgi:CRP/FNR family transcriptional regulator, cyclic AMP receptor protein
MSALAPSLANHPFARGLTAEQTRQLAGCARRAHYPEDAFIFREGGEADTLYLLQAGRVALEQHLPGQGITQLENLTAGDVLGLSWILPAGRWTLDARAVEAVEAFALDARCVRTLMGADPEQGLTLATHLIDQLYHRLIRVRMQRLDLYGNTGTGS